MKPSVLFAIFLLVTLSGCGDLALMTGSDEGSIIVLTNDNRQARTCSFDFSRDSAKFALAYYRSDTDSAVKIWDTNSGNELLKITGAYENIRLAEFSPDGTKILTSARFHKENTVDLWDAASGKFVQSLKSSVADLDTLYDARFSPDGTKIFAAGEKVSKRYQTYGGLDVVETHGFVQVWDAASGKELFRLENHSKRYNREMLTIAFSADGKKVATTDGIVAKIWDAQSGRELQTLGEENSEIKDAFFSPDGKKVATRYKSGYSRIWDVQSGSQPYSLEVEKGWVSGLFVTDFSPDGKKMIVARCEGNADNAVWIQDADSGKVLRKFAEGHGISSATFSRDGKYVVTGDRFGGIGLWEADSGTRLESMELQAGLSRDSIFPNLVFSPDGTKIAIVSGGSYTGIVTGINDIQIWKLPKILAVESGK